MMPALSGNEVIARLRSTTDYAHTPIILLSLRSGREDIAAAKTVGATDYFVKPFDPDALLSRVAELLTGRARPTSWVSKCLLIAGTAIAFGAPPVGAQTILQPMERALSAHERGEHDNAAAIMQEAVVTDPANVDLWLRLGLELSHSGKFEASTSALSKALSLAPEYAEARAALERVRSWAALEREKTRNTFMVLSEGPVETMETRELRTKPANVGQWSFAAVHSESWLSVSNAPKWQDSTLVIGFSPKKGIGYLLQAEDSKRFGGRDVLIAGQGEWRLSSRTSGYLGATIGLKSNSRETWSARAGVAAGLGKGLEARLDGRLAEYASGTIAALTPHLSYTLPSDKATITTGWINLWDETGAHQSGWSLRADVRPSNCVSFYIGAADYPDTENGITQRTSARFAGLGLALTPNLRLTVGFEKEARRAGATRRSLSIGLRWLMGTRSP